MKKIKILIADDHAVLRDGLRTALGIDNSIEITGEAVDGGETIEKAGYLKPDIILMDINMPHINGITASRKINQLYPDIKIIVLSMYDNKKFILDALSTGIDGYILKMSNVSTVLKAISTVASGDSYFDNEITKELISQAKENQTIYRSYEDFGLTNREQEIVKLTVQGFTAQEVADKLFISQHTVYNHKRSIFNKLKIKNTAELVKVAITEKF